jgi:hypothetical protein
MSAKGRGLATTSASATRTKSRVWRRLRRVGCVSAVAGVFVALTPGVASAHGPVNPVASSYLARVASTPRGLEAKVVDGDQRMWLQVAHGLTAVVLDYRAAPYLRFSTAGVEVNRNSAMYYLNQTPVPLRVPAGLGPHTRPAWQRVSGGERYSWHDGRLHALATVALAPGASFIGHWRIQLVVDGRRAAISGGLWHANNPSIVWFWPIVVLLAVVLAGWRLRRPRLDRAVARGLGIAALAGSAVAVLGRDLHGRPGVSVFQLIELAVVLVYVAWALHRLLLVRHGYFTYFVIAIVALWQGAELIPTLLQGFVLTAEPAFLSRGASVVCLAAGLGLLLMVFRLADERDRSTPVGEGNECQFEDDNTWELA